METIVESLILVPKDIVFLSLVPIANGSKIDPWIQVTKVGDDCFFHDGAQMPTDLNAFCPLILTSTVDEIHLRADGSTTYNIFLCGHDSNCGVHFSLRTIPPVFYILKKV